MMDQRDASVWRDARDRALSEETALDFNQFGHADAWALGGTMVSAANAAGLGVTIAINFGEQRVFHVALAGTSATNDDWLARKIRAVYKHNCSSWAMECQLAAEGRDYYGESGYRVIDIALAGGAVPLRVRGSLIGAVAVSGLTSEADHRFVVDSVTKYAQH